MGASYAMVSLADMALAGIESKIPVDEVNKCYESRGVALPEQPFVKQPKAGLPLTPTGRRLAQEIFGEKE